MLTKTSLHLSCPKCLTHPVKSGHLLQQPSGLAVAHKALRIHQSVFERHGMSWHSVREGKSVKHECGAEK